MFASHFYCQGLTSDPAYFSFFPFFPRPLAFGFLNPMGIRGKEHRCYSGTKSLFGTAARSGAFAAHRSGLRCVYLGQCSARFARVGGRTTAGGPGLSHSALSRRSSGTPAEDRIEAPPELKRSSSGRTTPPGAKRLAGASVTRFPFFGCRLPFVPSP